MSVVGFDVGCQLSKVAVAHRQKISVVPNELTKLLTPTLTAFGDRERTFGDGALTQYNRNYKNTIAQLKRWLGRKANDPKIQKEAAFWLPGVTTGALPDGRFAINVVTSQGQMLLAPEQILSGFFGQLKKFTSKFLDDLKVTDCVIACPSYFDDAQRRSLNNAARLAELKVLRLLDEPTAAALQYGILRNLPENETQRVIFFDFGYSSTQVAIVDFVKGKLSVRYKSSNPDIGGRDFDRAMYEFFRKQWQTKYNTDIDNLPKQKLKLIRACEKIKKLLTGNKDALWTLDCFHNDNDFKLFIKREEMEAAAQEIGVYDGMTAPLIEALEATKDDKVKIHSCEIIGGPSRVASVQTKVLEVIQKYEPEIKSLSTTLNGDECVSRGCALMCAMLSPNFRVKEFQVQDILTWPITISYPTEKQTESKVIEQLIMQRGNPQPCTAKVMFNKTENFVFKLQHPEEYKTKDSTVSIEYPFKTNSNIGEFSVQLGLTDNNNNKDDKKENEDKKIKIKLLMDIDKLGVLAWPKASLLEWKKEPIKTEEKPKDDDKSKDNKKDESNKDDKTDKNDKNDDNDDVEMKDNANNKTEEKPKTEDDKMDVDNDGDKDNKDKKDKKDKKKKDDGTKTKKYTKELIVTGNFFNELKAEEFNKMFELEANLINVDRIVHETDEAKNELETYVYALRDKIDTSHRDYIKEDDREKLSTQLTEMEDWVYDEGDTANKTQFLERLKQLKDVGDPMDYKQWEFEHREQRITNIKKMIFKYQQWVNQALPQKKIELEKEKEFKDKSERMPYEEKKYPQVTLEEIEKVKKISDEADSWLTNEQIKQDRLKKYDSPTLRCKDIDSKMRSVYKDCNDIVVRERPKEDEEEKKRKAAEEKKKKEEEAKKKAEEEKKNKEDNKENKDKKEENGDNNDGDKNDVEMESKDKNKNAETNDNDNNGDNNMDVDDQTKTENNEKK